MCTLRGKTIHESSDLARLSKCEPSKRRLSVALTLTLAVVVFHAGCHAACEIEETPTYEVDTTVYMAPYVVFEDLTARHEPTGIIIQSQSHATALDGSYFTDSSWGGDSGTVLISEQGIEILFPEPISRVDITAGWMDPSDRAVRLQASNGTELEGQQTVADIGLEEIHNDGAPVSYHVFDYELTRSDVSTIKLDGHCLLNRIVTYKEE